MKQMLTFISCVAVLLTAAATDCIGALQTSLRDTSKLAGIVMNTGKGINDLGDYEGCEQINGLIYASLRLQVKQNGAYLGICMPQECSNEDFSILIDAAKTFIDNPDVKISISFPSQTVPKVSTGNIVGFIFFGVLLAVAGVGIATEYTSLFNKSDAVQDGHVEKQKTKLGLVFLSFSFTRNIRKIFWGRSNSDNNNLSIFDGVRVLSMLYIIFGQGYITILQYPITDMDAPNRILESWPFYMVVGAFYAVDVFFFISGFFAAYVLLSKYLQKPCINIPVIYLQRMYRLGPPVLMVILFVITFLYFLGDGPLWKSQMGSIIDPCYKKWWEPPLLVANIIPAADLTKCLRWLWYIASNMQSFLFVPFQILAYRKRRLVGYGITYFLLFLSVIACFLISATTHLSLSPISDSNYLQSMFVRPFVKIGSYEVGVLFGMFYFEWVNKNSNSVFEKSFGTKMFDKVYNSKTTRYLFYVIGFILINVLMIIQYVEGRGIKNPEQHFPQQFHNIFNGVSKQLFCVCLMLILMGPLTGRSKLLKFVLGSRGYTAWSRVTFMAYIIHLIVISMYFAQMRIATYATNKSILITNGAFILFEDVPLFMSPTLLS